MQPPGRPKMASVCSISKLLMSAWAPVSFIGEFLAGSGTGESADIGTKENDPPKGGRWTHALGQDVRQVRSTRISRPARIATSLPQLPPARQRRREWVLRPR